MTTDSNDHTADGTDVDGLPPSEAIELYLETRASELTETTLQSHRYRLGHFDRWVDQHDDVHLTSDLNGRLLHEYRLWRRRDGDLNTVSLQTQLSTLRVFIRFCEGIEVVQPDVSERMQIPSPKGSEGHRDETLDPEVADHILDYLETYSYASRDHVTMLLLWRTGMRIGELQSLDVPDFDRVDNQLWIEHRPEGGTTLKNGQSGQRVVALTDETVSVVADYIEMHRHDVTDDHGREPLVTTTHGRPQKTTLRRSVYRNTQPCQYTGECPHGRDPEDCDDRGYQSSAGCPSVLSPHDVRRGSITHYLSKDVPENVVSERMNVSSRVLDKHYDKRSEPQKAEQRRKFITDI